MALPTVATLRYFVLGSGALIARNEVQNVIFRILVTGKSMHGRQPLIDFGSV